MLIDPLDTWVLRTATAQLRRWQDAGLPPLTMAINLSKRQLINPGLGALIAAVLDEAGLRPGQLEVELPGLSAEAQAKVSTKGASAAGLIRGPFNYVIRRAKIISRGRGHVKGYWRLESEEYFEQEEPRLGIVLQVPKEVSQVDAVGVLKACKDFHTLTAHVRHLLPYVKERTRNFFKQGAPLSDSMQWHDVTADV